MADRYEHGRGPIFGRKGGTVGLLDKRPQCPLLLPKGGAPLGLQAYLRVAQATARLVFNEEVLGKDLLPFEKVPT